MITLVLCDRTANGTKLESGKKTAYRCPTGKDAAIVLEQVVLCGARSKLEQEEMAAHLYDPEIGGRTLLEPIVRKDTQGKSKVYAIGNQFAR